jgi:mono/diheme cytochrome c family protein
MKPARIIIAVVAGVVAGMPLPADAQQKPDFGKREYDASCAACHGISGKGNGPLRPHLVKAPSDLTTVAKRNGGVFPVQRLTEVIDGRASTEIGPHGTREMPAWGARYLAEAKDYYAEVPFPYDSEAFVRARIATLIDYLNRLQGK